MTSRNVAACGGCMFLLFALVLPGQVQAQAPKKDAVDAAIAKLRNIDQKKIPAEARRARAMEVQKAWETIVAAEGAEQKLKAEVRKIDASGKRDDFFKLSAAGLLWQIGGLDEAGTISRIWETTSVHVQYNYTFLTAFQAAQTHDNRAVPMLIACLKDKKGSFFVQMHSMNLTWPLTHEFIWGVYGPTGLPPLEKLLETSKNPVELQSAMLLLARAQRLSALAKIRRLAATGKGEVRYTALRCLGYYGHPDDFKLLIGGLKTKDPDEAFLCAAGLYDYGDLRAVSRVIPLLKSPDEDLRREAFSCLVHLLTPEGLEALKARVDAPEDRHDKEGFASFMADLVGEEKGDWASYSKKTAAEKAALVARFHKQREARYRLKPADRRLSREQFLEAIADWRKRGRITGGKYEWVQDRHVLAVATAADITRLLEVKAAAYRRLSDECLYETRTLDDLIQRLGRKRYRKMVGVCGKVEPK